ncbi:MAG: hypothetical protein ACFFKA_08170, partial [Candidatus Thorarchaeota archaeon]
GIFDAPHLKNNKFALGQITTKIVNGACYSWDIENQRILNEQDRIKTIIEDNPIRLNLEEAFQKKNIYGKVMNQ